jgi:nicotinic acetylcholine receptor
MNTREMLPDSKNDARVHYTGHIKVNMPLYVTCICRLSIERFPFDSQFCAIAQASPLLTIEEMESLLLFLYLI